MATSQNHLRPRARWTGLALAPLIALGLPALAQADAPQEPEGPAIEDTRAMLDTWIELRKTISKTTTEWKLTREMMVDQIALMKANIEDVKAEIAKKNEDLANFDTDIKALEAKEKALIEASDKLAAMVEKIEAQALALVERAPKPLSDQVKPIAVQIPGYKSSKKAEQEAKTDDAETKPQGEAEAKDATDEKKEEEAKLPPLSRRTENVIGVLYLFNKFANKIEQNPQSVAQPDGSELIADTVFLGLSYAYYVDDSSTAGGFGWGAPGGWVWQAIEQPEVAPKIRKAVSVFNSDEPAAYVGLPAEVK